VTTYRLVVVEHADAAVGSAERSGDRLTVILRRPVGYSKSKNKSLVDILMCVIISSELLTLTFVT
jgi:hypothetical protein